MLFAMIWWFVSARKWFHGPRVNIEHLMLGREGNTVQGQGKGRDSSSETQQTQSKGAAELKSSEKAEAEAANRPVEI